MTERIDLIKKTVPAESVIDNESDNVWAGLEKLEQNNEIKQEQVIEEKKITKEEREKLEERKIEELKNQLQESNKSKENPQEDALEKKKELLSFISKMESDFMDARLWGPKLIMKGHFDLGEVRLYEKKLFNNKDLTEDFTNRKLFNDSFKKFIELGGKTTIGSNETFSSRQLFDNMLEMANK